MYSCLHQYIVYALAHRYYCCGPAILNGKSIIPLEDLYQLIATQITRHISWESVLSTMKQHYLQEAQFRNSFPLHPDQLDRLVVCHRFLYPCFS